MVVAYRKITNTPRPLLLPGECLSPNLWGAAQAFVTPAVLRASCFMRRMCVRLLLEARLGFIVPGLSVLVAMESTPSTVQKIPPAGWKRAHIILHNPLPAACSVLFTGGCSSTSRNRSTQHIHHLASSQQIGRASCRERV